MATFKLRRFSKPGLLRAMREDLLVDFMQRFESFFDPIVPPVRIEGQIDCDRLADVLGSPPDGVPSQLIDALHFVDELATEAGHEALLEAVSRRADCPAVL
ncbi:MAG: hypothetical protein KC620_24580, partial [Myxococcales bacterium]|nr:hypothetical protein [Myxococcales bacterium]